MSSLVHIDFFQKMLVTVILVLLVVDEEQRFGVTHKERLETTENKCGRPYIDSNTDSSYTSYVDAWRSRFVYN